MIPAVTVLMPCKNANAFFLKQALDSVFGQTTRLWNLIVITDETDPVIVRMLNDLTALDDKRVRVADNQGSYISGAFNTGMRLATTPYVCALHCDDLLDKKAVQVLNRYIAEFPATDYFYSSRMTIDEKGTRISGILPAVDMKSSDFKKVSIVKPIHCWKVSSALQIGGVDESLGPHGADDYDFPWCMAEAGFSFQPISECLYYYRDHRAHYRLTTHIPLDTQINELRKIFQKHGIPEYEIEQEIRERSAGYLQQALFLDEADKQRKHRENFDIRNGWRQPYITSSKAQNIFYDFIGWLRRLRTKLEQTGVRQ
jgi:glycosyltransferase involved in cell wall biosynthesis